MPRRRLPVLMLAGLVALSGAACSSGTGTTAETAPPVEPRTFTLALASTPLRIDFLAAELSDLEVMQRVRQDSGEVVEAPKLRGTLTLTNTSADRSVRLIGGAIEYLGRDGAPIALATDRGDTGFTFYSYSGDRVDPGEETSQSIEVPFPAAAMTDGRLAEVRLRLTYIPTPYRSEAATVSASLAGHGA